MDSKWGFASTIKNGGVEHFWFFEQIKVGPKWGLSNFMKNWH